MDNDGVPNLYDIVRVRTANNIPAIVTQVYLMGGGIHRFDIFPLFEIEKGGPVNVDEIDLFNGPIEPPNEIQINKQRLQRWLLAESIASLLQTIRRPQRHVFNIRVLGPVEEYIIQQNVNFEDAYDECCRLINELDIRIINENQFDQEFIAVYGNILAQIPNELNNVNDEVIEINEPDDDDRIVNNVGAEYFRELPAHTVCSICFRAGGDIQRCFGACFRYFHKTCEERRQRNRNQNLNNNNNNRANAVWLCSECPRPYIVTQDCHNCSEEENIQAESMDCVACSLRLHKDLRCIPVGAHILTQTQFLCHTHSNTARQTSINICLMCSVRGNNLLKCETCPATFHSRKCLNAPRANDLRPFHCTTCRTNHQLKHGDVVYARNNSRRKWWPALIVPLPDIPLIELNGLELGSSGLFCVKFFGTEQYDWCWRSDVLTFEQFSDSTIDTIRGTGRDVATFNTAIQLAKNYYNNQRRR